MTISAFTDTNYSRKPGESSSCSGNAFPDSQAWLKDLVQLAYKGFCRHKGIWFCPHLVLETWKGFLWSSASVVTLLVSRRRPAEHMYISGVYWMMYELSAEHFYSSDSIARDGTKRVYTSTQQRNATAWEVVVKQSPCSHDLCERNSFASLGTKSFFCKFCGECTNTLISWKVTNGFNV